MVGVVMGRGCIVLLKNVLSSKGAKLSLKSISFKVTDKGRGVIVGVMRG